MNISLKSLALTMIAGLAVAANASDVTSVGAFSFTNWYQDSVAAGTTVGTSATPTNDGDGSLRVIGKSGYATLGAFQGLGANTFGFQSFGSLGALSTGSMSGDFFRSSTSDPLTGTYNVAVKLIFENKQQLIWENAYNANVATQDAWFSQNLGSGHWYMRNGSTNYDGTQHTLAEWATGAFVPTAGVTPLSSTSQILGFSIGVGSLSNNVDVAFDHLSANFTGGNSYNYNFQAVPEPGTWAALGLGAVAFLRRRKRA